MIFLQFTNPYGEIFWFVRLGTQWPHRPECRLIDSTTANRAEARVFESEEEARTVLAVANNPPGWKVVNLSADSSGSQS